MSRSERRGQVAPGDFARDRQEGDGDPKRGPRRAPPPGFERRDQQADPRERTLGTRNFEVRRAQLRGAERYERGR